MTAPLVELTNIDKTYRLGDVRVRALANIDLDIDIHVHSSLSS